MDLLGKSISELLGLLSTKKISSEELQIYFKNRVEMYNDKLNAFVTVADNNNDAAGNLAGIPLSIKDNFNTKGIQTTASSEVLKGFISPYNATVVQRLYDAGIHLIGKTNMDAWAHGSSTETSDFGPSKNPWDTSRVPGGSSGGSAVSVSAYLSPASIGTETAGSIRQPASWCGVIGLKPTYGRVSRYGVIAMGSSLDCPGPLTLSVKDAALLLGVIAGEDPYDATTSSTPVEKYTDFLDQKKTYSIGITEEYFEGVSEEVKNKVQESIKILEKMGHTVKNIKLIPPKYSISVYTIIQRSEVSSNLARYDGIRYGQDRRAFKKEAKKRIMLGTYTLSHGYYDAYYKKAQKVRELIKEDFRRVFNDVDFIIAPSTPTTALKLGEFEKYSFFGEMMDVLCEPAAVAGLPAINLLVGLDSHGLPIGMQIMGNYFNESGILNLANQFEQETNFFDVIKNGVNNYK